MMALGLEPILSSKSMCFGLWSLKSRTGLHSCRATGVLQYGKEFRAVHREANHSALINMLTPLEMSFEPEMAPLDKGAEGSSIF